MCGPYVHTKESLIMSTLTTGTYEKYGASYKTLTLTDGEYAFTVTPEKGGMATSFTKNGDEYLWLRDKNFESTDRPRCGIPILFPNCGKPDDGVHHFNGAAYPIEVHGLADLVPWQVKSADDTAIELTLTPNGLTKFVYPFDFSLTMRYTLTGSTAMAARQKLRVHGSPALRHPHPVPELRQTGRRRAPLQRRGLSHRGPRPGRPRAVAGQERGRHRH